MSLAPHFWRSGAPVILKAMVTLLRISSLIGVLGLFLSCSSLEGQLDALSSSGAALTLSEEIDLEALNGSVSTQPLDLFGKCRPADAQVSLSFVHRDTDQSLTSPQPVFCSSDLTWSMEGVSIPAGRIKLTLTIDPSAVSSFTETQSIERYLVWGMAQSTVSYNATSQEILYYNIPTTSDVGGVSVSRYQYALGCVAQGTSIVNWTDLASGATQVGVPKSVLSGCSSYYLSFRAVDASSQPLLEFFLAPITGFDNVGTPSIDSGDSTGSSVSLGNGPVETNGGSGTASAGSGGTSTPSGSTTSGSSSSTTTGSSSSSSSTTGSSTGGTTGGSTTGTTGSSSLTVQPKGGATGDPIALDANLSRLVTVTNTGTASRTGDLSLAGTDAARMELACVSGCTPHLSGEVSYTLAAGASLKLLVVKKSDFSSSLSASLDDDDGTGQVAIGSVSTTALGYRILFWFSPSDLTFSHVTDSDASGTLSQGDAINSLPDRSGNARHLSATSTTGKATYVASGSNGYPNLVMSAGGATGTRYVSGTSSLGFTAGNSLLIALSAQFSNVSLRQDFGADGTSTFYSTAKIDWNTYQTAGTKHGVYVSNNSYDVATLNTQAHVNVLHFQSTTASSSVSSNTRYYIDQTEYTLTGRGLNGSGVFSSTISTLNTIGMGVTGTVHEAMIVDGASISSALRSNLRCTIALKNGVNSADCL